MLANLPFIGSGIFSLTKEQLLLLWNHKDRIRARIEMDERNRRAVLSPEKVKKLALDDTGSLEEADSVKCNFYHQNYKPSY